MSPSRPHLPGWLLALAGAAVSFGGAVTYFTVFARYPALRDVPWVNLPLTGLGVLLAVWGVVRSFRDGRGWLARAVAGGGTVLAVLFASALTGYVFWLSAQVPAPTETATTLEVAPDVRLLDFQGAPVSLADFRGKNVLVVFYRGFW